MAVEPEIAPTPSFEPDLPLVVLPEERAERMIKRAKFDAEHLVIVAEGQARNIVLRAHKNAKKIVDNAKSEASGIARPELRGTR